MSNSKVRLQIEAQEAKTKLLDAYKKKSNFILDFQMCKAYFKDSGMSVTKVVENILKAKYNLPWQEKIIRKVLNDARGKSNALISIPQFKYEKATYDILKEFVEKNIGKMAVDKKSNNSYPLVFNDLVREYS
jgi:hypothetical protein